MVRSQGDDSSSKEGVHAAIARAMSALDERRS